MSLRHTSKSHLSDVCTGGRNPTGKLDIRESMRGDFFFRGGGEGGGGGGGG